MTDSRGYNHKSSFIFSATILASFAFALKHSGVRYEYMNDMIPQHCHPPTVGLA